MLLPADFSTSFILSAPCVIRSLHCFQSADGTRTSVAVSSDSLVIC